MLKAPEVLSLNEHPPPSINSTTVVTKHAVHPRARLSNLTMTLGNHGSITYTSHFE